MDIQVEKLKLIEWVAKLQDVSILEKLKQIQTDYDDQSISDIDSYSIKEPKEKYLSGKEFRDEVKSGLVDKLKRNGYL